MPDARRRLADFNAASLGIDFSSGFDPFASVKRRFPDLYQAPRLDPTVAIGGQTYREYDNGRAKVLVPVDASQLSPAQLEERRRAVARVQFMTGSPLGAAAFGLASLARLSPGARDAALAAGGLADLTLGTVVPRATPARNSTPPAQGQLAPSGWPRPNVNYRDLNAKEQATGVAATLTTPMLGTGARASRQLTPPGWQGNGNRYNEARGHLLAKSLGGAGGRESGNFVTLTQNGANSPQMRDFERALDRRVRGGEVVDYSITPLYDDGVLPPSLIVLTAHGSRGGPSARLIRNPAGRRK